MSLPDRLTIQPIDRFDATVELPGSKSLTNRALLLAALADGASTLTRVLFADDSRRMLDALQALGFELEIDEPNTTVTVQGQAGRLPAEDADLFLGNAGTATRFLTAALCLGHGTYKVHGIPRMHQRPIGELVEPLRELGATVLYDGEVGFPPLTIVGKGLAGGELTMEPTLSSQFISALLQLGPCMPEGITLRFDGPVISQPYVEMTTTLMERFGAQVLTVGDMQRVTVQPGGYRATDYAIEPDASNATYFLAAAAVTPGGRCTVPGLGQHSLQGDVCFAHVLKEMGCAIEMSDDEVTVYAPADGAPLRGIDVDLNAMPDTAQTLASVALFAQGPTTMRGVGNLRVKETDRLAAVQNELTKLGATVSIIEDTLIVNPPTDCLLKTAVLDTYDDHRMAMSLAVAGLGSRRSPGAVTLNDPACVNKTFPDFFDRLAAATASA